jgi:gamma-glutamyl-gamma-aminobutyrate hydrolase PuuD
MPKRVLIPFRHPKKLRPYADAVLAGGMEPIAADVAQDVQLGDADGLLLMGGTDINPALYRAEAAPETDSPDDSRDETEWRLLDEALAKDLPILAICRGLQILNAHHGGTLVQHLPPASGHDVESENKGSPAHEILIDEASLLGHIAGTSKWHVNSRHHQAADRVGNGLRVVARAEDGTIEALEQPDRRFLLAVQWHPEDQINECPEQLKLFRRFAATL